MYRQDRLKVHTLFLKMSGMGLQGGSWLEKEGMAASGDGSGPHGGGGPDGGHHDSAGGQVDLLFPVRVRE